MNDEYRSAEEIQAHLEQLKQDQAALERALKERQKEESKELAAEIKEMIIGRGHDVDEIANLISGGKAKRRRATSAKNNSSYTKYADPDNPENVYTRGRMPQWLTNKMAANGYDPKNAEHRQQFKEEHLTPLAA
ncbi:H-NS histone family protein [Halochromatium salexigens]|uniref:DNA-binding protein H-NS-like C-terminal domain-containing protein n=1 Tax=Halochromatium salexigens TaxID=49447 RepID=A0AAJ0UGV9_HALSE|nr:H-NS histone family protein [Halochromatium salexigens]MBK5931233.1 hypothetical protein [Halochromatium salexigens]